MIALHPSRKRPGRRAAGLGLLLVALLASGLAPGSRAEPPIVLDGRFEAWDTIEPAAIDPLDAPHAAVDFHTIRLAADHDFIYFDVDFGGKVSLRRLPGRAELLLDVDGRGETGRRLGELEGADLVLTFSPPHRERPEAPGLGIGAAAAGDAEAPFTPHALGFVNAPTHAARRVEFRLARRLELPGIPPTFTGKRLRGQFRFHDWTGAIAETTRPFTWRLPRTRPTRRRQRVDLITRHAAADFRVVTWNVAERALVGASPRDARLLKALAPDILLLQELAETTDWQALERFLAEQLPRRPGRGGWRVIPGAGGGPLRAAIATPHPAERVPALDRLPYPRSPDRHVRAVGARIRVKGRALLAISVHLKCCGGLDSREDALRRLEARRIHKAATAALSRAKPAALLVGGDLNLVGDPAPRRILGRNLDPGGGSLQPVRALDPAGRTHVTWSQPGSRFPPAQLDALFASPSSLLPERAFVLRTDVLAPRWLRRHGLEPEDTARASDHFPLVADFRWRLP